LKKIRLIGLLAVVALLMTGCGLDAMPELTDDESAIISEYAAGLLLKYSPNYDYKLVDDVEILTLEEQSEEESEVAESSETETATEAESLAEAGEVNETIQETESEAESADSSAVSLDSDLAEILGISDDKSVAIVYSSYEVCDSYPETSTGFSVSASQNSKLLVVHFDLKNKMETESQINLMDCNLSATATINGERSSKTLNTLLPNDMISYYNNMKSGEVDDVVMLFQINGDLAENLEKISLKITAGANMAVLDIE
jgi:hypothetical protein